MNIFRTSATVFGLALVVIYAIASGLWVSSATSWYQSLKSPSWQPPDWVFGVIWPYNFIVLGPAAFLTLPVLIISFTASRAVGVALIPYQIWLVIAASLSIQYARLN